MLTHHTQWMLGGLRPQDEVTHSASIFTFVKTRLFVLFAFLFFLFAGSMQNALAATGPCDIYAAGSTPCVAAHSTVRALFGWYSGKLYQVKRATDGTTQDISVLSAGGVANAAAQDTFCAGSVCTITKIYDQSGYGNDLTVAPAGGNGSADIATNATALKVTVGGKSAYALYVSAGVGYRRNITSGIATGSASEGIYMVTSAAHVNDGCCFDYGNAETSNNDTGNGHMDAVYFGRLCWFACTGAGPWVMADLENGLFLGGNGSNTNNTGRNTTYVTAMVKQDATTYSIRDGDAQSGGLKTDYAGPLPTTSGYVPFHKEGAIILGIGGDNSKVAVGNFYEGAMTSGKPSDATEDAVQANIVAAGYSGSATGSYKRLVNQNSNKCMDVQQPNTSSGANVDLYTCNGYAWQSWLLVDLGNGYVSIVSENSGMCLDVNGASTANGANVAQYTCNGGANQQWQVTTTTAPWFRLTARNSGKVLDVANCGTADTTNIQQWAWLNNACQQWKLQ
ncbi:arabinofuranosidase catalytic domain-containing protein [Uliginosibacterium gangwonense]|uniref:arabinofuranosidase catalytic domain-containing protein n=1 Tax=Uliginosibacterium gangwonense TaxID=392736 RepID=UPI00035E98E1|nr:arabinofuranosidase catalytic domain-containing protein [Uliginosibacterium gangwonense]